MNSFIQNLDALASHSVVIAATNHEELLDAAVWRRFGYRLALRHPTPEMRAQMWTDFMKPQPLDKRDLELLIDLSEGYSGSDIREVATRLRRRSMMTGTPPELSDAFQVLQNIGIGEGTERRFLSSLHGLESDELAKALRSRDAKLYSHAALAQLLGISKATAYRHVKGGTGGGRAVED